MSRDHAMIQKRCSMLARSGLVLSAVTIGNVALCFGVQLYRGQHDSVPWEHLAWVPGWDGKELDASGNGVTWGENTCLWATSVMWATGLPRVVRTEVEPDPRDLRRGSGEPASEVQMAPERAMPGWMWEIVHKYPTGSRVDYYGWPFRAGIVVRGYGTLRGEGPPQAGYHLWTKDAGVPWERSLVIPHTTRPVALAANLVCHALAVGGLWLGLGRILKLVRRTWVRWRAGDSTCPHCGYDLHGLAIGACPECGEGGAGLERAP